MKQAGKGKLKGGHPPPREAAADTRLTERARGAGACLLPGLGFGGRGQMRGGVRSPRPTRGGFTLIEVMIVIGIMAVLMAITIPSYRAMSTQNQRNSCAANLKQIGQALALFREDYQLFPPDVTEYLALPEDRDKINGTPAPADCIRAAYDQSGRPLNTGVRGRGLFTLYYLGVYSAVLPPVELEPATRLGPKLRQQIAAGRDGLNAFSWYRSGGYLTNLNVFHCPANPAALNQADLTVNANPPGRSGIPTLGGWNGYDVYYRRNFWKLDANTDSRHLCQPYPPADTVVTWCPHHRREGGPAGPGVPGAVQAGDVDLVLFADGSVHRMVSREDNRMFEEPRSDTSWPAGPVM